MSTVLTFRRTSLRIATAGSVLAALALPGAAAIAATAPEKPATAAYTSDRSSGTYRFELEGGDDVTLDAKDTTATVKTSDGTAMGTLAPRKPGPVTSGYSGWKYTLFIPASKPDLNPPHLKATFKGQTAKTLYFTPSGAKPAPSGAAKDTP
ncbi:hypothetical protein ACFWZ2_41390 [Streptomyces sp. NPDC059002]|uniref:hypothetical protein n=1 Tax=Streptomyces sp. NPDC059002 TaxID=3346690 RepID=UPI003676A9BA